MQIISFFIIEKIENKHKCLVSTQRARKRCAKNRYKFGLFVAKFVNFGLFAAKFYKFGLLPINSLILAFLSINSPNLVPFKRPWRLSKGLGAFQKALVPFKRPWLLTFEFSRFCPPHLCPGYDEGGHEVLAVARPPSHDEKLVPLVLPRPLGAAALVLPQGEPARIIN